MRFQAGESASERRRYWLRWRPNSRALADRLGEPLFFHHIAKTGGTSLVNAICAMTPAHLHSTENGNLSAAFIDGLLVRGLVPGQFIYGHPATGAAQALRGRVRIVTLLREPCEQVISNYLWLRTERRAPDHAAARSLGFREFLLARPYFAMFQGASLYVGIDGRPIAGIDAMIGALTSIFAYLEEMHAVGTLDQADRFLGAVVGEASSSRPLVMPHQHRTRAPAAQRAALRLQFAELQSHPSLAPIFAVERAVYEKARSLASDLATIRCS